MYKGRTDGTYNCHEETSCRVCHHSCGHVLAVNDAITNGSGKWDPAGSTEGDRWMAIEYLCKLLHSILVSLILPFQRHLVNVPSSQQLLPPEEQPKPKENPTTKQLHSLNGMQQLCIQDLEQLNDRSHIRNNKEADDCAPSN